MIKISKKSQYGLRAMVVLAQNYRLKKFLSVKKIAKKESIPFNFLEKIILQLEEAKLIKSRRGISGGYILNQNPRRISIYKIIFSLEKIKKMVDCTICNRTKNCLTKNVWFKLQESLEKTLKNLTLEDLIK